VTTEIAKGGPRSPESLARGMFPSGFPRNPGELTISARESGNMDAKGDRRRPSTDGRAVLRTHTCVLSSALFRRVKVPLVLE
jgi:hypothetical protein